VSDRDLEYGFSVNSSAKCEILGTELGWNPSQGSKNVSHALFGSPDLAVLAKILEKEYRPRKENLRVSRAQSPSS